MASVEVSAAGVLRSTPGLVGGATVVCGVLVGALGCATVAFAAESAGLSFLTSGARATASVTAWLGAVADCAAAPEEDPVAFGNSAAAGAGVAAGWLAGALVDSASAAAVGAFELVSVAEFGEAGAIQP